MLRVFMEISGHSVRLFLRVIQGLKSGLGNVYLYIRPGR